MIETTITKIQYDADGVQRRWSIPFPYADAKHISIYTKVGEEPTVKVVDNYDIDEDDSVVIYPTVASGQEPIAAGTKIIIARETPETQLEDASQVHFTSKDVERGLDKLTMITQELSTTASETMDVSADAFEAAEEAVSTANEANATAGEAKTLAEQAVSVANDANATATAANTKSDTAIKIANDANEKSTAAVSTANTAKTVAYEANSTANKANATATEAKEIAAVANTTANNADKTANEADKKADNAVIIANNAKSIAEGIDAKATQALDNSNTAINTANSSKQIAEGIDGKATQALANSTTALETATEAKNTADSYQGQISTIEAKIPSAASETNQLADKQFVQDLTSALNFVQWVDALPETGESKYIYAVPREETDTDGKQIAALYLWDGSAWRGAGAFSLNIDPATLATKSEAAGSLSVSNATLTLKNVNGGTLSTVTVNNVANATTASKVVTEPGRVNAARYVYFEDSRITGKINYVSDFKYNPSTNVLTVGSITGTADKANKDGDGNVISSTYLKLSGGTLTGDLTGVNSTFLGVRVKQSSDSNNTAYINSYAGNLHLNNTTSSLVNIIRMKDGSYSDPVLWKSDKAVSNGVASLDSNAKIPENQLPDSVANQAILREW